MREPDVPKVGFAVISRDSDKSEPALEGAEIVPGWTPEVGTRLKEVIRRVGGLRAASAIVDTKAEQIAKWRDGKARPPFYALQQLAAAAGVSLDWIASGRELAQPIDKEGVSEPHQAPFFPAYEDEELFARVTDAVAKAHQEMGSRLPPIDLGRIVYRRYVEICSATDDPAERIAMVKLVKAQTLAELRAAVAAPGAGKASA